MNKLMLLAIFLLCACTYRGYTGEVSAADRFLVEARNGAVLGWHSSSARSSSHSYYSRGEFAAGQSSFHAATEFTGVGFDDEGEDENEYANLRQIQFSGVAGASYWLLPRNATGMSLTAFMMPGPYEGYQLVDQQSGVVVAVIP